MTPFERGVLALAAAGCAGLVALWIVGLIASAISASKTPALTTHRQPEEDK